MNLLELAEKWEREADTAEHVLRRTGGSPEGQQRVADQIEKDRKHAAELRAAITEQPLSCKWREWANEWAKGGQPFDEPKTPANVLQDCAADLDSYHDRQRELLREAWHQLADARLSANLYGEELERVKDEVHLRVLQNEEEQDRWKETEDRIRKHLEGDSDE